VKKSVAVNIAKKFPEKFCAQRKSVAFKMNMKALKKETIINSLMSEEEKYQIEGMQQFRKMISKPMLDVTEFLEMGVLTRIIELMKKLESEDFLMDAVWSLTNFASTSSAAGSQAIIKLNGLEAIRAVFDKTERFEIMAQCLWAFANVCQDSERNRDLVMSLGIFSRVLELLRQLPNDDYDHIQIALWTLGSLNNSKYDRLAYAYITSSFDVFLQHFFAENQIVKLEALRGIKIISEQPYSASKIAQIIPELIGLVDGSNQDMQKEALRVIGNIVYSNETRRLIDYNLITSLKKWINTDDEHLIKESTWIISNIAADGFANEIYAADIFPRVIELLTHANDKIRREAIWVVKNLSKSGSFYVCKQLVGMEVIRQLTKCLGEDEIHEILLTACGAIYNILLTGRRGFADVNLFEILVDKYGGLNTDSKL
jgi:importin subunit alpha-6/7